MKRLFAAIFCLVLTGPAFALHIRTYNASRHERYAAGFPAAPVANPSFMHAGLDLSGVGWDASYPIRQVTLITPRHFVCANHFRPPVGGEIQFLSSGGVVRSAVLQSLTNILNSSGEATDIIIGRLAAPLPDSSGVKFLSYYNLDTEAAYVGKTLGVLGAGGRGGRGVINAIADFGGDPVTAGTGIHTTRTMQFNYASLTGNADDSYVESGDSGSPSFAAVNGKAAIAGTHTAVLSALGTTTTVDSFLPAYVAQVNAVLEGDGYHLTPATPKSTTLSWSLQSTPSVLRAGFPVTLKMTVTNAGAQAANNVRLDVSLPGISSVTSSGTAGWIFSTDNGQVQAHRGGLAAGAAAEVILTFTPGIPGMQALSVSYKADEAAGGTASPTLMVMESFKSWTSGLQHKEVTADDDGDGTDNLTEYAFGGDPQVSSSTVTTSSAPLLPVPLRTEPVSRGHARGDPVCEANGCRGAATGLSCRDFHRTRGMG
jgi:hypothetical protein